MHISTRQCKTTFCTHYKVLAAEEEGTGTWLACLQSMRQRRPRTVAHLKTCKCFTVPTFFGMCCRSEWQERMYIYKWHEVDQTKHEIFCVHIVCNEIQVKENLEITTFFFYLRFPYCPNFFWFGVVDGTITYLQTYTDNVQYTHTYTQYTQSTEYSSNMFFLLLNFLVCFLQQLNWSQYNFCSSFVWGGGGGL